MEKNTDPKKIEVRLQINVTAQISLKYYASLLENAEVIMKSVLANNPRRLDTLHTAVSKEEKERLVKFLQLEDEPDT